MTQPPPPPHDPNTAAAPAQPLSPNDEKLYATIMHVLGIFFGFIPSLIVYLVFKDRGPFIKEHSRVALNFQIGMAIVQVANFILGLILTPLTFGIWGIIQVLVALAVGIVVLIFSIMAAIAANKGEYYRYPLSYPFIKN